MQSHLVFEILAIISLIGQLKSQQKIILHNLIHATCALVLYAVEMLIISFIVFEILTIITLIGQLTNYKIFKNFSNIA